MGRLNMVMKFNVLVYLPDTLLSIVSDTLLQLGKINNVQPTGHIEMWRPSREYYF